MSSHDKPRGLVYVYRQTATCPPNVPEADAPDRPLPAPQPASLDSPGARPRSLRTRLLVWTTLLQATLLLGLTVLFYLGARTVLVSHAQTELDLLTRQAASGLARTFESVKVSGNILESTVGSVALEPEYLRPLQQSTVVGDPNVKGTLLIIEPGRMPGLEEGVARYVLYTADGRLVERNGTGRAANYAQAAWYRDAMSHQGSFWSEPFKNENTDGEWFIPYYIPLHPPGTQPDAPPVGLLSVDMPVQRLLDQLGTLPNTLNLRVAVMSPDQRIVVHPDPDVRYTSQLAAYVKAHRPDLQPLVAAVGRHETFRFSHRAPDGTQYMTQSMPIGDTGWTLSLSLNASYALADLNRIAAWTAMLGFAGLLLWIWLVRRHALRLLQPVEELTHSAMQFKAGNFDDALKHTDRDDEVGVMARAFDRARTSIRAQMDTIARYTAEQERSRSALEIAHQLQHSMLPPPPVMQGRQARLDVDAQLIPANGVAGDFYHFLQVAPGVLWFAIGDVSDKGVGAAMFMARTMSVLEMAARLQSRPDQVLAAASMQLVERNQACMFATVLCGVVELETGRYQLASAGHEPPLMMDRHGKVSTLPLETGPLLGIDRHTWYPLLEGQLNFGDTLLAYTDGVIEASDTAGEQFGLQRLQDVLQRDRDARGQCSAVLDAVHAHANNPSEVDDMAVMAMTWLPPRGGGHPVQLDTTLRIPVGEVELGLLSNKIDTLLERDGVLQDTIDQTRLMIEEHVMNLVQHGRGGDDKAGSDTLFVEVRLELGSEFLVVSLHDNGPLFDPRSAPDPDLDAPLEARQDGGLGLMLMRHVADYIEYNDQDGFNTLRITLRHPFQPATTDTRA